jgi:hypothetical protein
MIITETWKNNDDLQNRFESSLTKVAESGHRLSKNYSSGFHRDEIIAYSMSYDNDQVYLCSTIGTKQTWPAGVYRLINRVFKPNPTSDFTKNIQPFWVDMIHQQLEICKQQKDFQTAIITRRAGYRNTLTQLKLHIDTPNDTFYLFRKSVWVLEHFSNPECYQDVLYYGNQASLENFKFDPCIVQ